MISDSKCNEHSESEQETDSSREMNNLEFDMIQTRSRKRKQTHLIRDPDVGNKYEVELQITFPVNFHIPNRHTQTQRPVMSDSNSNEQDEDQHQRRTEKSRKWQPNVIRLGPNCASRDTGILSSSSKTMMDLRFIQLPAETAPAFKLVTTETYMHPVDDEADQHPEEQDNAVQVETCPSKDSSQTTMNSMHKSIDAESPGDSLEVRIADSLVTRRRTASVDIDLNVALGMTASDCTAEKVAWRKMNIRNKFRRGGHIILSKFEEFDIHCRADTYASSVSPDPDHCFLQPEQAILSESSMDNLSEHAQPTDITYITDDEGRKRRRHLPQDGDYYVVHPCSRHIESHEEGIILPQGMCLLRPAKKLVELVAQAINESPDCMLQVQQVYHALQGKYPYFRYMDKASTTSWRSSIRHALYQKWFRKIPFQTDVINCKGCYWAINRKHRPREWTLPPCKEEYMPHNEDEDLGVCDMDNWNIVPSVAEYLAGIEAVESQYEVCALEECTLPAEHLDMGEVPPINMEPYGEFVHHTNPPRDPDPMLTSNCNLAPNPAVQHQDFIDCGSSSSSTSDVWCGSDLSSEDSGCDAAVPTWWCASWDHCPHQTPSAPHANHHSSLSPLISSGAVAEEDYLSTILSAELPLYWHSLPLCSDPLESI